MDSLDTADIIAATPEKLDAVTRGGMRFFSDIGLVLIGGWVGGRKVWLERKSSRRTLLEGSASPGAAVLTLSQSGADPRRQKYVVPAAAVATYPGVPHARLKGFSTRHLSARLPSPNTQTRCTC